MNRINHLKQTLLDNIEKNYLLNEIQFILLDYNSSDGLEDWIKNDLINYIQTGILVYYKTYQPKEYHRSHSRNMAFRLADSYLVCNLDADNYLGKGFGNYMINAFKNAENVFYTSDYAFRDIVGRICLFKSDFQQVRGYNELMGGYGFEDIDFINRLKKNGKEQKYYQNPLFYNAIRHSNQERISQESIMKNIDRIYLHYVSPYIIEVLLFYKNKTMEIGLLMDNMQCNYNIQEEYISMQERCLDERFQIIKVGKWINGIWKEYENYIKIENLTFIKKSDSIYYNHKRFYKINDPELQIQIIFIVTGATNFEQMKNSCNTTINPSGFGKGIVYKNFNNKIKISLE